MTELVETKFRPPLLRPSTVERVRLLDRLGRQGMPKLTLVSAPPGFGKSTLLAQSIAAAGADLATAWLSLEATDDEPITFWAYIVGAVERAIPGAGTAAQRYLDAAQPRGDLALSALVNSLLTCGRELAIVLDDFHVIEASSITQGLTYLIDHLPANVHLVILTRADPALPLARLRAHGELVEVRAADLRFTVDEAATFLKESMGISVAEGAVRALEARTEGWIAALQLAAISIRDGRDAEKFITTFAGDDRFVVDYLADEVLERQPESIRTFLLRTSILERLSGPLCDAVTGDEGGRAMLESIDRANLFLVPLDDQRHWYRYHHLFADLLRTRLAAAYRDIVPTLHRRASAWWEAHGERSAAIGHALDGEDFDRAAALIEQEAELLLSRRQEVALRRWLDRLPDSVYDVFPVLADAHAGSLLVTGSPDRAELRLAQAERWLEASASADGGHLIAAPGGAPATNHDRLRRLPGAVALHRAGLSWVQGDLQLTIEHARRAIGLAENEPVEAGSARAMLGLAAWSSGDLPSAYAAWSDGAAALESAGHFADALACSIALGDIAVIQGRVHEARRTYEHGLELSGAHGRPALRGAAEMHVGLAEIHLEWDDVARAAKHLDDAAALGSDATFPQYPYRSRVARAGLLHARGDVAGALALVDEAEDVYEGDFFPEVRPVSSIRARLWVAAGRLDAAFEWARGREISIQDEPSYLREHEHLTLARALLAKAVVDRNRDGATALGAFVERLLQAAEGGGRSRSLVELLVLRALAFRAAGDPGAAASALDRALLLGEPQEYVRIFLDEGPVMAELLAAAARRDATSYAARLLGVGGRGQARGAGQRLIEPLSDRELEVLRLLPTDLDGPAMAAHLFVSLNTLRSHTKSIFAKLGVSSRRAAVARAAELGLLPGRH